MPKYVVRYGVMRHLGVFSCRARERYARGHRVIARTVRGQEAGEVLCEATEHVVAQMPEDHRTGQILRIETPEDAIEQRKISEQKLSERELCEQRIRELELDMKLVDVERLYGGERVVVYYLAEQRIDFRELVKNLAKDLQTRVEMRHIGVRDEAKLLADYGDCGKPVCCNTHLSEMPPVSMKMAKLQKATLDPTKISGRCGRLKCCLRYEYDTYQAMQRELPKVGSLIITNEGRARVLSQELLSGELLIETEDSRRIVIPAADVLTILSKSPSTEAKEKSYPKKDPRPAKAESLENKSSNESSGPSRSTSKQETPEKSSQPDSNSPSESAEENTPPSGSSDAK